MGVGGAQIGFMSGFGLGGIAERGREEDFFPSVASFAESIGKCINQKQNRFLLAQRFVGFFDQRFLHLSKVSESPVRQQEWGGDWGSVSWWCKEKEAKKYPVPPKSSKNSKSWTVAGNTHVSLSQLSQTDLIQIPSSQEIYIGAALHSFLSEPPKNPCNYQAWNTTLQARGLGSPEKLNDTCGW